MKSSREFIIQKIDSYFSYFESCEKYKFDKACEIYNQYLVETDTKEKEILRNKLIFGTMYRLKKHIKKNYLYLLESSELDVEDIINDSIMIYIELIDSGIYTKIEKFSRIFYLYLDNSLLMKYGNNKNYQHFLNPKTVTLLKYYVNEKNQKFNVSYNEFYKYCKDVSKQYTDYDIYNLYVVFLYIYNKLDEYQLLDHDLNDFKRFYKVMASVVLENINFIDLKNKSNNGELDKVFDEELNDKIFEFLKDIDSLRKYIVIKSYGLDGEYKSVNDLHEELGLPKRKIASLKHTTLNIIERKNRKELPILKKTYIDN